MKPPPPSSILIVRLSAIGDVIHALPVVDVLRQSIPQARIGWIVEELSAPLLAGHPGIDTLYVIPRKRWRGHYLRLYKSEILPFFRKVRSDGWEATLDMQGILKSGYAAWMSGARLRVGFAGENDRELNRMFQTRRVRPRPADIHVAEQNARLLEGLGVDVPAVLPPGRIVLSEEEIGAMRRRLAEAGWKEEPLLGINAGGGFASKLWPAASYARLGGLVAGRTGMRPLVFWGPGEEHLRDEILAGLSMPDPLAAPKTTIRESAVLTSLCSLFIGGDTGPSQIAGMLGIPTLAIFGGTEAPRNHPWPGSDRRHQVMWVQRDDLACVPCWERRCPLKGDKHMQCMNGLHPKYVYTKMEAWLDRVVPRP